MSDIIATPSSAPLISPEILEQVITGDLSKLTPPQRVEYLLGVCKSLGLNPATRPFDYIILNGKLTLYARRDCAEQLRRVHGVSLSIIERENIAGVYVVTAKATIGSRQDESTGAVFIDGLKGEQLANAMMRSETKAKRRVTLSICGLGLLDETEVEDVVDDAPRAKVASVTGEVLTKRPAWTDEQTQKAGEYRREIMAVAGDAGDQKVRTTYGRMKYDQPDDVLNALSLILKDYQDREPVVVTDDQKGPQ